MRKRAGDTLIEVMLAVGIFSMIAIAIVAIMNGGSSGAQTSLESTLAREEVDTQAEALRFIQSAYIADLEADQTESKYVTLWQDIAKRAVTSTDTKINLNDISTAPSNCKKFYDDNSDSYKALREKAFIINPSRINNFSETNQVIYTPASISKDKKSVFSPATTYPRLIYNANQLNNKDNLADNTYGDLYRAEGIYVVAVKDRGSTAIINIDDEGDGTTQGEAVFFDFYIRTCWYGVGDDTPSSISTVVRLYDPDALAKLAADNIRGLVQVSYKYENSKLKPGQKELEDQSGYKAQTYNGENRLERTGYTFIGWCSGTVIPHNDGDDECRDGNVYQSDTTIKNPNEGILTLDLTAMWSRNRYTINYNPDGGSWANGLSNTISEVCYETNESGTSNNTCRIYSADEPTRSGYSFGGWCKGTTSNETCSGTTYNKQDIINPFADNAPKKGTIDLKAVWEIFNQVIQIEATWNTGSNYGDYDTYVKGEKSNGSSFLSYFGSKAVGDEINGQSYVLAELNQDGGFSGNSYNETFTLNTLGGKNYYYYVYNRPQGNMASHQMKIVVKVKNKNGTWSNLATYTPSSSVNSSCKYWNVFAYKNGRIVKRDTCSNDPETSY